MTSYYLNGREKDGKILLKNAKFMRKESSLELSLI